MILLLSVSNQRFYQSGIILYTKAKWFFKKYLQFLHELSHIYHQSFLQEEGLFRKPGSVIRIKTLRQHTDDVKGDVDLSSQKPPVVIHDACALLKQFIRDMPEPLLTCEYNDLFTLCPALEPPELRLYTLQVQVPFIKSFL